MPSRYEAHVDPAAPNNCHAYILGLVGWNKSVLELGAAAGHVTRALAAQGNRVTALEYDPEAAADLKEVADQVVVGDLNDPGVLSSLVSQFDVVVAGDVLEHLLDPLRVVRQAVQLLTPGGSIVISLPHVGHVDVRLSLLEGRFDYNNVGLLDDTHIRFFTLKTLRQMVERAGLVITELRRVRIPAFETELRVDRGSVPTEILERIFSDPEAETYQFVFQAVPYDGDYKVAKLADQVEELRREAVDLRTQKVLSQVECEHHRSEAEHRRVQAVHYCAESERHRAEAERYRAEAEHERGARQEIELGLSRLLQTRTYRYTNGARRQYARLLKRT